MGKSMNSGVLRVYLARPATRARKQSGPGG